MPILFHVAGSGLLPEPKVSSFTINLTIKEHNYAN